MLPLKVFSLCFLAVLLLSLGASIAQATRHSDAPSQGGWWSARRDSAGIAPDPRAYANLAIVQVYAAPTYGWKGAVAVHPWIIFKRAGKRNTTATR